MIFVVPSKTILTLEIFPDEELIRWMWPEDVWFHVDKLSSAHVYLRLKEVIQKFVSLLRLIVSIRFLTYRSLRHHLKFPIYQIQGETLDDVPKSIIEDAAQLVKYNSIQGNKMNDIDVVYTMWNNLQKTDGMDVGQVRTIFFLPGRVVCEYFYFRS